MYKLKHSQVTIEILFDMSRCDYFWEIGFSFKDKRDSIRQKAKNKGFQNTKVPLT